jgi:hypothetical protein
VLRSFITSSAFQTGALTATASLANLVEEEGIEPSFAGCRPAVLPLNDSPEKWLRAGELNATLVGAQNGTCSLCACHGL